MLLVPLEFQLKDKNTGDQTENVLANLERNCSEKMFLDLYIIENTLKNLRDYFYSLSILYHTVPLASE